MKKNPSLTCLLLLAVAATICPQPLFAAKLSASDLIAQALAHNPELHYYESEIAAARGGKTAAGQWSNPDLNVEYGHKRISDRSGPEGEGRVWKAQIMQTIEFPNRVSLRKAIADHDIALAELGVAQFRSQLGNEIRSRAGDVVLLRRKESAARSVRKRFEELVAVLVQRDTGTVSAKLERRILEASLLTSDRAVTDATVAARETASALNAICGRAPDAELDLDAAQALFPAVPSLLTLKEAAAKTNFDVQQKRLQLARQGLKVDLTKSERWGNISFGPYLAAENTYEFSKEFGVGLSIPLPLWNKNKGNIDAEKARTSQAEAMLAVTLRDLERDLVTERASYAAELDALSHWKPESEGEFQAAAEEADKHYRLGAVPATTYVEMQRQYLEAMGALIETRRNAWLHLMHLEKLTGSPIK